MRAYEFIFESINVKQTEGQETIDFIKQSKANRDLFKSKRIRYFIFDEALKEHHIMILDGKKVIAMAGLQVNPYEINELWIKFVSVDPDYQGQGYARKLLELVYEYARQQRKTLKSSTFTDQGERLKHIHNELNKEYPDIHKF